MQQFHIENPHITTYDVELDAQRAIEAREKLLFAVQGSILDERINPLGSVGLLYLNPPYDWDDGERLEMKFLKHAHKWLCTDGVLVFLVPELIFLYEKHRSWIGQHFYDIRIVRVTKADYPAFKQVVLFGKKRKERHETGTVDVTAVSSYRGCRGVILCGPADERPRCVPGDGYRHRRGGSGPLAQRRPGDREHLHAQCDTTTQLSPLLPLRKGHLTSLLTAGILDGKVETVDGPMILKGFSDRAKSTYYEDDKEITHDTFSVGIRVIEPRKGVWYDIK